MHSVHTKLNRYLGLTLPPSLYLYWMGSYLGLLSYYLFNSIGWVYIWAYPPSIFIPLLAGFKFGLTLPLSLYLYWVSSYLGLPSLYLYTSIGWVHIWAYPPSIFIPLLAGFIFGLTLPLSLNLYGMLILGLTLRLSLYLYWLGSYLGLLSLYNYTSIGWVHIWAYPPSIFKPLWVVNIMAYSSSIFIPLLAGFLFGLTISL